MEMLALALVTGLWYWIWAGLPGYGLFSICKQPIIVAVPIGLVMGDLPTAIKIGASIEMVYLGMIAAGGNIPSDKCLAALIAIPVAIKTGMKPEMAVTIAVPLGILGVFINNIRRTVNAAFAHKADKYAEECNTKGIWYCATLYPMLVGFILRFPPVFLANLYGAELVQKFLNFIPKWIMQGLTVAGGLLPALGFAMTIFIIGKNKYIPFFIIGFYLVKYLNISITAAAIFGTCIALLIVFMKNERKEELA